MFIFLFFFTLITVKISSTNLDLLALPSATVTSFYGSTVNHDFGFCVRDAGDVNGDNVDDVIIGSPSQSTDPGVVYVIYGNHNGIPDITLGSLIPAQGFTIIGPTGISSFGMAVSRAGDLNADGIGDIIIGAPMANPMGAAYVIFGTTSLRTSFTIDPTTLQSSHQGFIISGSSAGSYLGNAVSYAGDINGDNLDDVIVGAYLESMYNSAAGKAYVIFGKNFLLNTLPDIDLTSPLSNTDGITIQGDTANEYLGASVSNIGDFNGDGIDDIIVGGFRDFSQPGTAYVIFGSVGITDVTVPSGLNSALGFQIQGMTNGDSLGWSVSYLGDINKDGLGDVIVGCPQADPMSSGAAYVILGKAGPGIDLDLTSTPLSSNNLGFKIYGSNTGNALGFAVSRAGDLNKDGKEDLAVATWLSGPTGSISTSTVYVIFGSSSSFSDVDITSLSNSQGFSIQNLQHGSSMPVETLISSAGDVNGDGFGDLIIGSPNNGNSPAISGSAHLIYGIPVSSESTSNSNPLQVIVDTENFGTAIGRVVAMAGSLFHSQSIIPLWFIFLEQILQYPKYLLIEYPYRLKLIYEDQEDFQLFSIPGISQIPDNLNNKIPEYSLPQKFEEYSFDSSFLVNFWNSFMTLLIILALIAVAVIVDRCTVSNQIWHNFFNKVKYTLKWNYIISIFTGSFCDIALFTSFELRTEHFDSAAEWISFFFCILVNLVIIAVSIKIALIIKYFAKRQPLPGQNRRRKRLTKASQDELKSYTVIFEGFKDHTLKQQSFFLLFSLRFYLFYMIIGYLFEHTLVQAILVNLVGIASLLFLGFVRPYEDKIDFFVSLTQEGALEVIHLCVFLFALDDQANFGSQGFRVVLGDIILACNAIFMGSSIIYSFILLLMLLKKIYMWISKKCRNQQTINSVNQNITVITSGRIKPILIVSNENKTELDKVNESQIYLNRQPTIDYQTSVRKIKTNQNNHDSNVLNNSTAEASMEKTASPNAFLNGTRLTPLNPRREERKRVEREKLAAESSTQPERLNQLKMGK